MENKCASNDSLEKQLMLMANPTSYSQSQANYHKLPNYPQTPELVIHNKK